MHSHEASDSLARIKGLEDVGRLRLCTGCGIVSLCPVGKVLSCKLRPDSMGCAWQPLKATLNPETQDPSVPHLLCLKHAESPEPKLKGSKAQQLSFHSFPASAASALRRLLSASARASNKRRNTLLTSPKEGGSLLASLAVRPPLRWEARFSDVASHCCGLKVVRSRYSGSELRQHGSQ